MTVGRMFLREGRISGIPYVRACLFYGFYYGLMGILVPFLGAYLNSLNLSSGEIGALYATLLATRILMPNLWAWIADKSGHHLLVVRAGVSLSVACLSFALIFTTFWSLLFTTLLFALFWNAVLPQVEGLVLRYLGKENAHYYSHIRLWGSLGFISVTILAGIAFQIAGIENFPKVAVGMALLCALVPYFFPRPPSQRDDTSVDREHVSVWNFRLAAILILCFLNQAAHGPQIAFFSIYAEELGYNEATVGILWSAAMASELLAFIAAPYLLRGFRRRYLLMAAFFGGALRWALLAAGSTLPVLLPVAQLLQSLSFGLYHAVMISFLHHYFGDGRQGTGQALYSSVGFGLGGAIGAIYAGYLWSRVGPVDVFMVASFLSLVCLAFAWFSLREAD